MNKFELGDRVYVNDLIGKITDIEVHIKRDRSDRKMKYRYEVTYDGIHMKDWFDEDEIELFVEKTCEASNKPCSDVQRNVTVEEVEKLEEELRRKDSELRDLKELIIKLLFDRYGYGY